MIDFSDRVDPMTRQPVRREYTDLDLQNAHTKGQVIGWLQGGFTTIGGLLVFQFVGWIPALIVAAVVGFVVIKLFSSRGS
jgi:hypothetical protein